VKKARDIRPENMTNYLLGIITESGAILVIMLAAFLLSGLLLLILKG
jgi:hypothetical protein